MNIREIAEAALADILSKPKGHVRASRRGMVTASKLPNSQVAVFRRMRGLVRLELWSERDVKGCVISEQPLPADLEERAAKMLDEL